MPIVSDIGHIWGGDIGVTSTGDIAVVSGADRTTQRVLRRLMTAATTAIQSDYPWLPTYGIGMGERVGRVGVDTRELQAIVLGQLSQEQSVATSPAPTVSVTETRNGSGEYEVDCAYTDQSGLVQSFSFDLSGSA
jgi:hypothetical protein